MLKRVLCAVAVMCLFSSAVVAGETATPEEKFKQRVKAANMTISSIDSKTLRSWIDDGEKEFILLDVREPSEVSAGKIEADEYMSIPRGVLEMQFIRKVKDLDTPVVVYCLKGSRGALATEALSSLGYTNIHNLKGGFLAWIGAGHPISNFLGEFELQNYDSNFEKKS